MHISRHNAPLPAGSRYPIARREIRAALAAIPSDGVNVSFERPRSATATSLLQARYMAEYHSNYCGRWGGQVHVFILPVPDGLSEMAHALTIGEVFPRLRKWLVDLGAWGNTWRSAGHLLNFDLCPGSLTMQGYDFVSRGRDRRLSFHWKLWPTVQRVA